MSQNVSKYLSQVFTNCMTNVFHVCISETKNMHIVRGWKSSADFWNSMFNMFITCGYLCKINTTDNKPTEQNKAIACFKSVEIA